MWTRRLLLAAASALPLAPAAAAAEDFPAFLTGLRAEARRAGIAQGTLDRALTGLAPNQKVLERDRHQPEFTLTWARYRALLITGKRIADGQAAVTQNRTTFARVRDRFQVDPGVIAGIWGLESSFGTGTGDFRVVEALATLAWEGRRAAFFRGELIAALKILDHGDITPARMTGSYAGAMGQPQFMPSSYLRYAVDFEGSGRRDIWTSKPDVLASIANYLTHSGWHAGEAWGQQVTLPPRVEPAGRATQLPLDAWGRQGLRPLRGSWAAPADMPAALLTPDGPGGEAFLVFRNFSAIRRYNPSDFYALAVGLLGDRVAG
ncbi:MAG TPA: lytic murein transglycosylase [Acetobacteraceae bacterium]|jgi:membrane-bound lytic murein transglycosylase B